MERGSLSQSIFRCRCDNTKEHKLVFDGGSVGNYIVELCKKCYRLQNKQFLISEERIGTTTAPTKPGGDG